MLHVYIQSNPENFVHRGVRGNIYYKRPFGYIGDNEAVLDIHMENEAEAYALFQKGAEVTIYDDERTSNLHYDGNGLLKGYIERHNWREDDYTSRVVVRDLLYKNKDVELKDILFVNTSLKVIIETLASKIGFSSVVFLPSTGAVIPTLPAQFYEEGTRVVDVLSQIAECTGGQIYASPFHPTTLIVDWGCLHNNYNPTASKSLTTHDAVSLNIEIPPREHNVFEVEAVTKEILKDRVYIATYENPFKVPPEGVGTGDEAHYIEFDMPVLRILDSYFDADDVTLDEAVWNSNFVGNDPNNVLRNPFKVKVKLNNPTAFERDVWRWWLEVEAVKEGKHTETLDNSGSDPKRKWKLHSDQIVHTENEKWARRRVNWEAARLHQSVSFDIVNFEKDIYIGLKSGANSQSPFVMSIDGLVCNVEDIAYDVGNERWRIYGSGDRSSFNPSTLTEIEVTRPTVPEDIPDMPPPQIGDGLPPATPEITSLTSFYHDQKSFVRAQFTANTEDDFSHYELEWGVQVSGNNIVNPRALVAASNDVAFEVPNDTLIYVRVRAHDLENLVSSWSLISSVQSAKEVNPPTAPSTIIAYGGYKLIYITWQRSSSSIFSHYELQRKVDGGSYGSSILLNANEYVDKEVTVGTEYWYRVRTIDKFGNASSWKETGSKVKAYSVDADMALHQQRLDSHDILLGEHATTLGEHDTTLEQHATAISQHNTTLGQHATTLGQHDTQLSNHATSLYSHDIQLSDHATTLSNHSTMLNDHDTQLSNHDTTLSNHSSKLSSLSFTDLIDSIQAGQIADEIIVARMIKAGEITTLKINVDEIVGNSAWFEKLTTNHLAAGAVTAAKIAAGTITANEIAAGTITGNKIAATTITASNIASGTITTTKIASRTITADRIAVGSLTANEIASRTITADRIATGAITANEIAATTITADKIATGTLTATQIATRTLTADRIAVGTLTATEIATRTLTADRIAVGTLTATEIASDTITANELTAVLTLKAGQRLDVGSEISLGRGVSDWAFDGLYIDNLAKLGLRALSPRSGLWLGKMDGSSIDTSGSVSRSSVATRQGIRFTPLGGKLVGIRLRLHQNNSGYTRLQLFETNHSGRLIKEMNVSGTPQGTWIEVIAHLRQNQTYLVVLDNYSSSWSRVRFTKSSPITSTDIRVDSGWSSTSSSTTYTYVFSEIKAIKDTNYFLFDEQEQRLKADLVIAEGENRIIFEDSRIKMEDFGFHGTWPSGISGSMRYYTDTWGSWDMFARLGYSGGGYGGPRSSLSLQAPQGHTRVELFSTAGAEPPTEMSYAGLNFRVYDHNDENLREGYLYFRWDTPDGYIESDVEIHAPKIYGAVFN